MTLSGAPRASLTAPSAAPTLAPGAAARFAALALACVHREYPNKIAHTLSSDADVRAPHELTPAFYGCLDWHSSVHGHWLLVRLARLYPGEPFAAEARAALEQSLTTEHVAAEVTYLQGAGRASFERPYGLAWLLQLAAELRNWDDTDARRWSATLRPLELEAATHVTRWLPNLRYPIRVGEHSQTAFAFGLIWDWARLTHNAAMQSMLADKARQFYLKDRRCPLTYEPSGEDFLSPCLGEADFMRRVLDQKAYGFWLRDFLPMIPFHSNRQWLPPGIVTDRSDPKLAHIDGLNLSRAWMLEGIASALSATDGRRRALQAAALEHRAAALPAVTGEYYEGGHWLATFAVYLTSAAGRAQTIFE